MLPKKQRIGRKSFTPIITKGKRFNSPHLLMHTIRSSSVEPNSDSRFSFSVSKKVASKAVDRNKYRRRGYSVIRNNINKIKSGFFSAFSFKKGEGPIKFSELEKEILGLLSSAGMLK